MRAQRKHFDKPASGDGYGAMTNFHQKSRIEDGAEVMTLLTLLTPLTRMTRNAKKVNEVNKVNDAPATEGATT